MDARQLSAMREELGELQKEAFSFGRRQPSPPTPQGKVGPPKPVSDSISAMQKRMRKGDIILMTGVPSAKKTDSLAKRVIGGITDKAMTGIQGSKYTHVGMYAGNGKLLEMRPGEGITQKTLTKGLGQVHAKIMRPKASLKQRLGAIKAVRGFKKQKAQYDFGILPAVVARRGIPLGSLGFNLGKKLKQVPPKMICSNTISSAYKGVDFGSKQKSLMLPGDFERSSKTRPVAAFNNPAL